jgi:hypothetical protein
MSRRAGEVVIADERITETLSSLDRLDDQHGLIPFADF